MPILKAKTGATRFLLGLVIGGFTAVATRPTNGAAYDWASATTGGDWTTTSAWLPAAPSGGPGSGDTATLGDATADRTINYNSTTGSLATLSFNQSSASLNELVAQRNLTVSDAITLAAASGTERLTLVPGITSNQTLTASGGITVNAGGELLLGVNRPATTSYMGQLTGDLTIGGGFVELVAATGGGTNTGTNTLTGSLTMTGGTFAMNRTASGDRRINITGDVDITGGSFTRGSGTPQFQLAGGTNTLNADAFDTGIATSLYRNGDQSLTTSLPLGKLLNRGWGTKTLSSSEPSGTVNDLTLIDGNNDSGGTPIGTTLRLGSNVTSELGLKADSFSQTPSVDGRVDFGIDVQTNTLAMPTAFIPNKGVPGSGTITDAVWTIAGNGGTIEATRFELNATEVTTNVGPGLTFEATGGDGTSNILSGVGTIDATVVFRYAGAAAQSNPATLISGRELPTIEVANGALNIFSLANAGTVSVDVASGATLTVSNTVDDAGVANIFGGTFAAGSFAGFNTFNGDRTYATPITGARGLSKYNPNTLTLSGANAYTGDTVVSAGTLALARADGDTYSGVISGGGSLTLLDSGTVTLTGQSTYAGATNLAGGTIVLSGGSNRLPTTTTFNFTGLSGALDVGSTSQTVAAVTVPVSGGTVSLAVAGSGGTLGVSGSDSFQIGPGGTITSADSVTLDMSSLANFSYVTTASGVFRVGMQNSANSGSLGEIARVTLAGANTITANSVLVSDRGGNTDGGEATLLLGQTNLLNTDLVNLGYSGRSDATLEFRSGLSNPTATIRAKDGTSPVPIWYMGNVSHFTSGTYNSIADFSAGTLDAEVTELYVGSAVIGTQAGRAGTQNATFTMGTGTLSAGTITLGRIFADATATVSNTLAANGTLTIGTGGGSVVADSVVLAINGYEGGTTFPRTVSGTINLSAGTLAAGSIALGAQTGNATPTTAFNWTGGTIANKAGGSLAFNTVPISLTSGTGTFAVEAGQSITVDANSPISGAGSLAKTGAGTLILQGAHTYAGATTISAGTLALPLGATLATSGFDLAAGALLDVSGLGGGLSVAASQQLSGAGSILGSLVFGADSKLGFTSSLTVDSGTVSFNGFGIDDIVGLDGTLVSAGTYTLLGGTATFDLTNALNVGAGSAASIGGGKTAYFQEGSFQVVVVPEPAVIALLGAAAAGLRAGLKRYRRQP